MARRTTEKPARTTAIGWQGYTINVPEDWTIGAIGGDHMEGYLRIDGTDMPRCEVKWFNRQGPVNLDEVVGNYLKELQKKRRRRDPKVTTKRNTGSARVRRTAAVAHLCWRPRPRPCHLHRQ